MTREHLHGEDCPDTLAILSALFAHRLAAAQGIGYEPTDTGAWVDWERLERSWLSTTETALVTIARGLARLERHGGPLPPHLARPLAAAIDPVTRLT